MELVSAHVLSCSVLAYASVARRSGTMASVALNVATALGMTGSTFTVWIFEEKEAASSMKKFHRAGRKQLEGA